MAMVLMMILQWETRRSSWQEARDTFAPASAAPVALASPAGFAFVVAVGDESGGGEGDRAALGDQGVQSRFEKQGRARSPCPCRCWRGLKRPCLHSWRESGQVRIGGGPQGCWRS